jgi:hypothetical protein
MSGFQIFSIKDSPETRVQTPALETFLPTVTKTCPLLLVCRPQNRVGGRVYAGSRVCRIELLNVLYPLRNSINRPGEERDRDLVSGSHSA